MNLRYLEHDELYREALLKSLQTAKRSLWLATATLKQTLVERSRGPSDFRPLAEELADLAGRGVEVRLLHSGKPSGPFLESLEGIEARGSKGFEMRQCPRVHFKTIIVDDASAYVGSANLTGAGLGAKRADRRNFEVGFWLDSVASGSLVEATRRDRDGEHILGRLRALFSAVWDGVFCAECGMSKKCGGIL